MLVVESSDKFDSSTLAVDCSCEEFGSIEASLYQVLHKTTANEPLRTVQQKKRTEGFRSMACDRERVPSEEHVGQQISIRSTDQQDL